MGKVEYIKCPKITKKIIPESQNKCTERTTHIIMTQFSK